MGRSRTLQRETMPKRDRLNLLVVHGDGTGVLRLSLPRWVLSACGVAGAGVALLAALALYFDYFSLKHGRAEVGSLKARLAEQEQIDETFKARLRVVRAQMESFRELHQRIWEPFGPEAEPGKRGTGVGGGTGLRHLDVPTSRVPMLEEIERLASMVTEQGESLRELEHFMARAGRVLASIPSRWPVRGSVNSEFGQRLSPWTPNASEFHSGIDIQADHSTLVRAPAAGTVAFAGHQPEYGVTLIIDHGNEIKSLYGHLTRATVTVGQRVERGQVVALSGNTGRSSGPHLHYEIQVKGQPVNPRSYLWD